VIFSRDKENRSKFKFSLVQDGKRSVFVHPDLEIGEYNLRIDPFIVGNELLV
jgi:hypothetical protein